MKPELWIYWLAVWMVFGFAGRARTAEVSKADSLRKYRFMAKEARGKKDYDAALNYYGERLKYESEVIRIWEAHFYIGKIYFDKKDFAAAGPALRRALVLDSLHVNTNLLLYQVCLQRAQPDSAALCMERVVGARPDDVKLRRKLADLYRRQSRIRAAIRHYTRLAEAGGGDGELFGLLAVLHEDMGEAGRALEWRQRLLEVQGPASDSSLAGQDGRQETVESILALQRKTGDVQGAFETLEQLVEIDSLNRYFYFRQILELAEEKDDESMRIRGLEGMVQTDPGDLKSVATLVEWHLKKGHPAAAHQQLERGLKVDPDHAHLQLLKGDLLELEGDEEEALAAFEKARADPAWEAIAQQRIWNLRPPETREEQLLREFFGKPEEE